MKTWKMANNIRVIVNFGTQGRIDWGRGGGGGGDKHWDKT